MHPGSIEHFKTLCMQLALSPTTYTMDGMGRRTKDEMLAMFRYAYDKIPLFRERQNEYTKAVAPEDIGVTSYNEDAMILLKILNELYPEG